MGVQEVRETEYLHALAPTLLFNALGLLCVKFERFKELNAILNRVVVGGSFIRPYSSESLLVLLGCTQWERETWQRLTGKKRIFSASKVYLECLRSLCRGCFATELEYECFFYMWEHLRALLYCYSTHSPMFWNIGGDFFMRGIATEEEAKEGKILIHSSLPRRID